MSFNPSTLPLLNIFVVDTDEGRNHLIAFLDPVRAGAEGIKTRSVVGGFTPDSKGEFDGGSFRVNPEFLAAFVDYMNEQAAETDELKDQASAIRSDWLYVLDPRNQSPEHEDPPASDVLGCFAVDDTGQIVPSSFQYNAQHLWFRPETGVSGLLNDRRLFDWLNTTPVG